MLNTSVATINNFKNLIASTDNVELQNAIAVANMIENNFSMKELKIDYARVSNIIDINSELIQIESTHSDTIKKLNRLLAIYESCKNSDSLAHVAADCEKQIEYILEDFDILRYKELKDLYNSTLTYRRYLLTFFNLKSKLDSNFKFNEPDIKFYNHYDSLDLVSFIAAKNDFYSKYHNYEHQVEIIHEYNDYRTDDYRMVSARTI